MLGLDTNVLVRFLGQDDQAQFARAQKIIGRESRKRSGVLISLLVLLQTEWVLPGRYSLTKAEILAAFSPSSANSIIRCGESNGSHICYAWSLAPCRLSIAIFAGCSTHCVRPRHMLYL